jgi:hypothetical protein
MNLVDVREVLLRLSPSTLPSEEVLLTALRHQLEKRSRRVSGIKTGLRSAPDRPGHPNEAEKLALHPDEVLLSKFGPLAQVREVFEKLHQLRNLADVLIVLVAQLEADFDLAANPYTVEAALQMIDEYSSPGKRNLRLGVDEGIFQLGFETADPAVRYFLTLFRASDAAPASSVRRLTKRCSRKSRQQLPLPLRKSLHLEE